MSLEIALRPYIYTPGSTPDDPGPPTAGVPASKPLLSWNDAVTIAIVIGGAVASIIAVYLPAASVALGQTNQLVIVGFCLTVMAMGTTRQVTFASLLYDVHNGQASLQDLESLLRKDLWALNSGIRTKLIVFLLTAIPLALSASYKQFVGGYSSVEVIAKPGKFGYAMPPGFGRVGAGLALAVDQYLPYWQDADVNRTYGFSLYVVSNTTAALLDAPNATYFEDLQDSVRGGDAVFVSATVNATVTESVPFSPEDLTDEGWNNLKIKVFSNWEDYDLHDDHGISASLLPETPTTRNSLMQDIITTNYYGIDGTLLHEFDYRRYPRSRNVNTVPALVGSRIAAMNRFKYKDEYSAWDNETLGVNNYADISQYDKLGDKIHIVRQRESMRRTPVLLFILLLNPVLTLLGVAVKLGLYHSPVDENFGLVSLLAAVEPDTLKVLSGAGMSGELNRRVQTRFAVDKDRIAVHLDEKSGAHRLERGTMYS
ncbi:hypothetical protein BKA63DRAFT_555083 [Paraphoma chrysanthemicola]|nr:hypothetical protein BKA63DRAFT_555083 [Paraphoma chrysanthemicola]